MKVSIRTMGQKDIDFAIKLTDLEGWGYSRRDFKRLLYFEPDGCFLAFFGGKKVGLTTTTSYGKISWVGNVIVHPMHRAKGIGESLVKHSLDYLQTKGVETIRLHSYMNTIPFYERLGFRKEFVNLRFLGKARGIPSNQVRKVRKEEVGIIAAFDQRYFGADRGRVLERLYQDYHQRFFIMRGEEILGYIAGDPFSSPCEIGPWVCDYKRTEVAEALLGTMLSGLNGREVVISVPGENRKAVKIAKNLKMKEIFRTMKMYWGKRVQSGDLKGLFCIAGLEKG